MFFGKDHISTSLMIYQITLKEKCPVSTSLLWKINLFLHARVFNVLIIEKLKHFKSVYLIIGPKRIFIKGKDMFS